MGAAGKMPLGSLTLLHTQMRNLISPKNWGGKPGSLSIIQAA